MRDAWAVRPANRSRSTVRTRPSPKHCCQSRFTATRAVSGWRAKSATGQNQGGCAVRRRPWRDRCRARRPAPLARGWSYCPRIRMPWRAAVAISCMTSVVGMRFAQLLCLPPSLSHPHDVPPACRHPRCIHVVVPSSASSAALRLSRGHLEDAPEAFAPSTSSSASSARRPAPYDAQLIEQAVKTEPVVAAAEAQRLVARQGAVKRVAPHLEGGLRAIDWNGPLPCACRRS